jgi:hypothetical protein
MDTKIKIVEFKVDDKGEKFAIIKFDFGDEGLRFTKLKKKSLEYWEKRGITFFEVGMPIKVIKQPMPELNVIWYKLIGVNGK